MQGFALGRAELVCVLSWCVCVCLPCRHGTTVCGVDEEERKGEADQAAAHRPRGRRPR